MLQKGPRNPSLYISVGRLGLGFLAQQSFTNTVILQIVAVFLTGASQILWGFWRSKLGMAACATIFGFCVASFGPTWSEVTMLLTGLELFPLAIGYSLALMGLGWMAGAPVAGLYTFNTISRWIGWMRVE